MLVRHFCLLLIYNVTFILHNATYISLFKSTDLRHCLEKLKFRKLTKEEKKTFFSKTKAFVETEQSPQSNAVKAIKPHRLSSSPLSNTTNPHQQSLLRTQPQRDRIPTVDPSESNKSKASRSLRSLTPDVFAQSRCVQMKFKKSIIQTGISASEPRRQKSNNKKAKKKVVLPSGSELSQQMLSLFDDDSDSPCSPGGLSTFFPLKLFSHNSLVNKNLHKSNLLKFFFE